MENEPPNAEKSEEVLGSVTHCYDIENGDKTGSVQLRTSARVSKKMRLDSTAAAVPPPTADIKGKQIQPLPKGRYFLSVGRFDRTHPGFGPQSTISLKERSSKAMI